MQGKPQQGSQPCVPPQEAEGLELQQLACSSPGWHLEPLTSPAQADSSSGSELPSESAANRARSIGSRAVRLQQALPAKLQALLYFRLHPPAQPLPAQLQPGEHRSCQTWGAKWIRKDQHSVWRGLHDILSLSRCQGGSFETHAAPPPIMTVSSLLFARTGRLLLRPRMKDELVCPSAARCRGHGCHCCMTLAGWCGTDTGQAAEDAAARFHLQGKQLRLAQAQAAHDRQQASQPKQKQKQKERQEADTAVQIQASTASSNAAPPSSAPGAVQASQRWAGGAPDLSLHWLSSHDHLPGTHHLYECWPQVSPASLARYCSRALQHGSILLS